MLEKERRIVPDTHDGTMDVFLVVAKIVRERLGLIHSRSMLTHADTVAVRVVLLVAGTLGWFVTGVDQKTIFFHAALEGHEEVRMKTPIGLWQWRFMIKGTLWRLKKEFCGLRSAPKLWDLT